MYASSPRQNKALHRPPTLTFTFLVYPLFQKKNGKSLCGVHFILKNYGAAILPAGGWGDTRRPCFGGGPPSPGGSLTVEGCLRRGPGRALGPLTCSWRGPDWERRGHKEPRHSSAASPPPPLRGGGRSGGGGLLAEPLDTTWHRINALFLSGPLAKNLCRTVTIKYTPTSYGMVQGTQREPNSNLSMCRSSGRGSMLWWNQTYL